MARDRGTNDELAGVHGILTDHFLELLQKGRLVEVRNKETGEVTYERLKPDAATYNQIRQFLKDNDIKSAGGRNPKLNTLAAQLPSFDDEPQDGEPTGATH
jgi:hypothetical protein